MNKHHLITILISSCLFMFLSVLIYTLYCYVFYDKNQTTKYITKYNNQEYSFLYNNYENNNFISEKDFYQVLNNTLNKDTLETIYNTYYRNTYTEQEFLNKFYYGDVKIDKSNINLTKEGKTSYGSRAKYKYNTINLDNKHNKTKLSIINNVRFITQANTKINIDNTLDIDCNNNCQIDYLLSGNHTIVISNSALDYFSIINITESNQEIDLYNQDETIIIKNSNNQNDSNLEELKIGRYYLSACLIKERALCATANKSYLEIYEDTTVFVHLYSGFEAAFTEYWGTYLVDGNFITFKFTKHTYTPYDYDTGTYHTIEVNTPSTQRFRIEGNSLIGEKHQFNYE